MISALVKHKMPPEQLHIMKGRRLEISAKDAATKLDYIPVLEHVVQN